MSLMQILNRVQAMGVCLSLNGGSVKLRGPARAIAAIKPELAPHKAEILAYLRAVAGDAQLDADDCVGALRDPEGGLYLPWGPHYSPDELRQLRGELLDTINTLASLEHWPQNTFDLIVTSAMRGPLYDLMPNLHHFRTRLAEARAEELARVALKKTG